MSRRIFLKVFGLITLVIGLLLLSVSSYAGNGVGIERAKEVQQRNTERLMAIQGVVGTAVAETDTGGAAVAVFLERPGVGPIPRTLEGVPVRPVVTGKFYALAKPAAKPGKPPVEIIDPTARFDRPVPIGVSTGHPAITAGTIGCRVTDGTNVYALSNNHVYANENRANIDDAVIQPGAYDRGASPADDIGALHDYQKIIFGGGDNVIDAAIALSDAGRLGNATPSNGYGAPKSTTAAAAIRMPVMKYGRTTGQTTGKVYAINATVNVGYDTGVARFVGQIVITPGTFSAGGDSGSLIVVNNKKSVDHLKPVGLLFAGSSSYTIANPIDAVLNRFGVSVDGQ